MKLAKKIVCLRYVIFSYVTILSLSCIAQITIGGILLWDHVSLNDLVENSFWKPAATLICIGLLMLLVCWLGWNSTRKKNRCNLMMFCTLLFLFGCVQLYVCYWTHVLRLALLKTGSAQFEYSMDNTFILFFQKYMYQSDHIWNRVQEEYRCCGVDGPTSYRHSNGIPTSCLYKERSGTSEYDTTSQKLMGGGTFKVHELGCLEVLSNLIRSHLLFVAISCLASIALELIGIFFTLQLALMLGRRPPAVVNTNMASKAFRMKLDADLQKPLADRRRAMESGYSHSNAPYGEGSSHV